LCYILGQFLTPEICLAAVQQYGRALEYVPEHLRTRELCMAAVQQDGCALRWIPDELLLDSSLEFYLIAIQQNFNATRQIKMTNWTFKLVIEVLKFNKPVIVHRNMTVAFNRVLSEITSLTAQQAVQQGFGQVPLSNSPVSTPSQASTIATPEHANVTMATYEHIDLKTMVENMKTELDEHYDSVLEWVHRTNKPDVIKYVDVQILALAIQTLADKSFRDVAIIEILGDNERCGDRTIMSINKFYLAWRFHCATNLSNSEKFEVLLSGARTIALRIAVAEALKFHDVEESVETFLFYETTMAKELNLLTLATGMNYSGCAKFISKKKLIAAVNDAHLKIAAEHPLLNSMLDSDTTTAIKAVREFYDEKLNVHIENITDASDSQYVRMLHFYRDMVSSEILEIKMKWLMKNAAQ
jgi:hypothetical protein